MSEERPNLQSRRRFLGIAAIGAAGAAGFVGGRLSTGSRTQILTQPPETRRFENKTVLITGATSGIGRATAIALAAEGAKVSLCGRRENLGQEVEAEIRANGGEATYIKADVRVEEDVRNFIDQTINLYGGIDSAFNNAGITLDTRPLHELGTSEWENVLNTNLRGIYFAMKYEIPPMLAAGRGNILVTGSHSRRSSPYSASKNALLGLIKTTALEYAAWGIRINILIPGTTDTALIRKQAGAEDLPEAVWQVGAAQFANANIPLRRLAEPDEIAAYAVDLLSDRYPFMLGSEQVLDGGASA